MVFPGEEDPEVDSPDLDEDVESEVEAAESPESELPDLAALAEQINSLRSTAATRADLERAMRAAGRIEYLQSEMERLKNADPIARINPTLSHMQDQISLLADGLADVLPDEVRARLASQRSEQSVRQMVDQQVYDRLSALYQQSQQAAPQQPQGDPVWTQATLDAATEAQVRGIDPTSIPQSVWNEGRALGSPARAVNHVIAWLDEQVDGGASERTTSRKRTAAKAPPSAGVAMSDDELIDDYGLHPEKYTSAEQRNKVYSALGRLQS